MKLQGLILILIIVLSACGEQKQPENHALTFCNPMDLSYRFQFGEPSRRESGDPTIVLFKGEYYLFSSKSGGYFHSTDLVDWNLITTEDLPLEPYAPAAEVVGDEIYFMTDYSKKIFKTKDPKSGKWEIAKAPYIYQDGPMEQAFKQDVALFLDDDGRLYYYGGSSNFLPTVGIEIDRKTLEPIGQFSKLLTQNKEKHGWERRGDFNFLKDGIEKWNDNRYVDPWIEGSCMIKYNGKYYLQYSTPGTEFKSYCDGIYISDKPLGPFVLAEHNPFACKPDGFLAGAGHGCTFKDKYGNYWHTGTSTISIRHIFERRLNLYPVFFDRDGEMYAYTGFGDYPIVIPDKKISSPEEIFPAFMLLSYRKQTETSSNLDNYPAKNAVDEEIRTWWSAETGNAGEWFSVDLGEICSVSAVQANFADQDAQLFADSIGRAKDLYYRYLIEQSTDGKNWKTLVDKSQNTKDSPHEYTCLKQAVNARYIRINNISVPSGKFSLYDFRIFGTSPKPKPQETVSLIAQRDTADSRKVKLSWDAQPDAVGYNIRYGSRENKLYHNHIVYGQNELDINSLHADKTYYFTVDAFNEAGITRGKKITQSSVN